MTALAVVLALMPASAAQAQATLITVTTTSDESNGTVSSAAALLANPGPDGVSLREALQVTNNDPGQYTIRFAPSLAGATIHVGVDSRPSFPSTAICPS